MTASGPRSDDEITGELLWELSRKHGWSRWIPEDDLVRMAVSSSEAQRGKKLCRDLRNKNYIIYQKGKGYRLKGMPEQNELAQDLRTHGYTDLQIETTLSPFERAGGFDS